MKSIQHTPVLALALAAAMLSGTTAKAENISFTLSNLTDLTAIAGETVEFDATITDTDVSGSPTIYLVGDSLSGDSVLSWDDSPFFWNFIPASGLYAMNPGDSFTTEMATVGIPAGTAPGSYTEYMEILGTTDSNIYNDGATQDPLALQAMTVDVPTPEPSSLLLMVTGLAGLAMTMRRKLAR
jgi:hypothetical protein